MHALIRNPRAFGEHLIHNFGILLPWAFQSLFASVLIPIDWAKYASRALLCFSLVLVALVISLAHRWSTGQISKVLISRDFKKNRTQLLFLCVATIPSVVTALLYRPQIHYCLLFATAPILATLVVLYQGDKLFKPVSALITLAVGVSGWLLMPDAIDLYGYRNKPAPLMIANTVRTIRSLEIDHDINMLDAEDGYFAYLDLPGRSWFARSKPQSRPFDDVLRDININLIIVSPTLLKLPTFSQDESWIQFLNSYQERGFKRIDVLGAPSFILYAPRD